MTKEDFAVACGLAMKELQDFAPKDTGNLAFNAIKIDFEENGDEWKCVISVDPSIAHYMPYTNEPWISPKWKGKKNPNEGWWQWAVEFVARKIAEYLGGTLYLGEEEIKD